MHTILNPDGWAAPRGYSHGISAHGRQVYVSGQIGWNSSAQFVTDDFVQQTRQALENVVAVLRAGGAGPEHLVSMTWFCVDRDAYCANLGPIGQAYRDVIGRHYPTMAVVIVAGLVEPRALVEIQAIAVIPD